MPTLLSLRGLRFMFYSNDHRPAHVHVLGGGSEAVFLMNCKDTPPHGTPELRENYGFSNGELNVIEHDITENLDHFCSEWGAIHGDY
jgi:hypothetical protein